MQHQKKRKIDPSVGEGFLSSLFNLPEGPFSHALSYLTNESRASFAVAITAPPSSFRHCHWGPPPKQVREILSGKKNLVSNDDDDGKNDWEVFDFAKVVSPIPVNPLIRPTHHEMKQPIASILTDDDLFAILTCIDAKNTVKKLYLPGCFSLTGDGLLPLTGSTQLIQIDLSRQEERYDDYNKERLSISTVVPILQSIADQEGNSLKHVHLPGSWGVLWNDEDDDRLLKSFIARYNQLMNSRSIKCAATTCSSTCSPLIETGYNDWGVQALTCHKCLDVFCTKGSCNPDVSIWGNQNLTFCNGCHQYSCNACQEYGYSCESCSNITCSECAEYEKEPIHCGWCQFGPLCRECGGRMFESSHALGSKKYFCQEHCLDEWEKKVCPSDEEEKNDEDNEGLLPLEAPVWQKKITAFFQG